MLRIGNGCKDKERPDMWDGGRTTDASSVSIALMTRMSQVRQMMTSGYKGRIVTISTRLFKPLGLKSASRNGLRQHQLSSQ